MPGPQLQTGDLLEPTSRCINQCPEVTVETSYKWPQHTSQEQLVNERDCSDERRSALARTGTTAFSQVTLDTSSPRPAARTPSKREESAPPAADPLPGAQPRWSRPLLGAEP